MTNNVHTITLLNAIDSISLISKSLEGSGCSILGLYNVDLQSLSEDGCNDTINNNVSADCIGLKSNIAQLSEFFGISPVQTLLLVAIYGIQVLGGKELVTIQDICAYFKIDNLYFIPLQKELDSLFNKGIVFGYHKDDEEAIGKSCEEDELTPQMKTSHCIANPEFSDSYELCRTINKQVCKWDDLYRIIDGVVRLEEAYSHLTFVKNVLRLLPNTIDRILFYETCYAYVVKNIIGNREYNNWIESLLLFVKVDVDFSIEVTKSIIKRNNALFTNGLVTLRTIGNFDAEEMVLTKKGGQLFCENICDCAADSIDIKSYDTFYETKRFVSRLIGMEQFRISRQTTKLIEASQPFVMEKAKPVTRYSLCKNIKTIMFSDETSAMSVLELFHLVLVEEEANKHLTFVQELKKRLPDVFDRVLFYIICGSIVQTGGTGVISTWLQMINDHDQRFGQMWSVVNDSIIDGSHNLIKSGLINYGEKFDVFLEDVELTDKGRHLLREDDYDLFEKQ